MPNGQNAFDIEGARKAGYSDDEILAHLTQSRKFDVESALKSGYSKADVIGYLSGTPSNAPASASNGLDLPGGIPRAPQPNPMKLDPWGDPWEGGGPSNVGEQIQQDLASGAKKVGDWVDTRDQSNLKRAATGQAPTSQLPILGGRMLKTVLDKASGMAAHPLMTAGVIAANSNPVTGVPLDGALFGYYGADAVDAGSDISQKGFTPENTGRLLDDASIAVPAGGGTIAQWKNLRDVSIDTQNVAAQRGFKPSPKGQEQFQRDLSGARPYLGGRGIDSQQGVKTAIPGAENEIWQLYSDTMDRVGNESVNGPDGPTTFNALEARRVELSNQLHSLNAKDPVAAQTIIAQGKTPAQLLDEQTQIESLIDGRLRTEGVNGPLIRSTIGSVKGIERQVSGRNTLGESPERYSLGRYFKDFSLTKPSTWLPGSDFVDDVSMHRPVWSGKPTDVDIKTGLLSGAEKPSFSVTPSPTGPQYTPQFTPGAAQGPQAPPSVDPQFAVEGTGGGLGMQRKIDPRGISQGRGVVSYRPDPSQNLTQSGVKALPTEHPGEGNYAGLLPGPPAPFVPPAPRPPLDQVGGLPPLGHPVMTDDPMWTGEARPGIVPTRGPAATNVGGSMTTPGWRTNAPAEPPAFTLPAGNPPTPPAPNIGPQPQPPPAGIDLKQAVQQTRDFPLDRRVNPNLRDAVGPDPMRQQLVRQAQKIVDDPNSTPRDRSIAQAQIADIQAHPFERASGETIPQMKAKGKPTMSKADAEKASAKRTEGRNKRFANVSE